MVEGLVVLLLLLLVVPDLFASLFLVVELLPLTEDLVEVPPLLLFVPGRYTLTEFPLTLVVLPERLFVLSSRRTVALLPVSRS